MNINNELHSLAGETLALTNILGFVFFHISEADPELGEAIAAGFDDAASHVENVARVGKAASPEHTVKALSIIEELRTASLGNG